MPRTLVIQRDNVHGAPYVTLGNAVQYSRGWKFFPATPAHKPSCKFHETLEKALPKWVHYPHSTRSYWKNEPIQVTTLKSVIWELQATIYAWPENDEYEVRISPINPTTDFVRKEHPRFKKLTEATAHAKIILGL